MNNAFLLITSNCYSSRTDFDLISRYLKENGWRFVRKISNADLIIIYTCAFVKAKEDLAISVITQVKKAMKKNSRLIITGCLPAINKKRLKNVFKGTTVSANQLHKLDSVINAKVKLGNISFVKPTGFNPDKVRHKREPGYSLKEYRLRIGWGCAGKCSYCVIRRVFGKIHSRAISEIAREFKIALRNGYSKFVLVANEVGTYGEDIKTDIIELLRALREINCTAQFALSNITPDKLKRILPQLEKFIRQKIIWRINVPVQSGSDKLLALMRRNYRAEDFKCAIERILKINPEILIETDVMVGFPQETKDDFYKTVLLSEWLNRNNVFFQVFPYDRRPHTVSSRIPGHLSAQEKGKRFKTMEFLCSSYFTMKNKRLLRKWKNTLKEKR